MVKRVFDVVIALMALVVLLPLFVVVGAVIRLSSPGPALFKQTRVGRGGADFTLLKFRTMRVLEGSEKGTFHPGDRTRVTRIGRLLRATKMDELPQLLNVLAGQMSLVGPRPEVRRWVEEYPRRWKIVHTVRPGVTDPASIVYRDEEEVLARAEDPEALYREEILPRKLDLYEQYVRDRSFSGDLRILWRTAKVVLFRKGHRA